MVTPLLEKVISAIIEDSYNIKLTGDNDVVWGFSLVVIGLTYHLSTPSLFKLVGRKERLELKAKHIEHDKNIFTQADGIMNGSFLSDFLSCLGNDHSYRLNDTRTLENICQFLAKDENQFISRNLEQVTQEFLKSSVKLLDFSAYKFYIFPDNQTSGNSRLCMAPALNMDRAGHVTQEQQAQYRELTGNLDNLIRDIREKYRKWRSDIKYELII